MRNSLSLFTTKLLRMEIKMRVLFVSTYEKMRIEIERLRNEFKKDEIDIIDLQQMSKQEVVEYIENGNCEIVITRGGTYRFVKDRTEKPVIPIYVTVYDIINVLDFSNIEDTLLVGVKETMEYASKISDLTNIKLNVLSLNRHEELEEHIGQIRSYGKIYSDYSSFIFLQKYGISCNLIESSYESIKDAYLKAENLYNELFKLRQQEHILDAYLLDENKNVYLYIGKELYMKRITNTLFQEEIEKQIKNSMDSFINGKYQEKCIYKNEYFIKIYNHHFNADNKRLTAIKVQFIKYSKTLADMTYQMKEISDYNIVDEEMEKILLYAASSLPIVISSLDEVLKRKAFYEIIENSDYRDSTPFYIRFDMCTDREIKRLFEDENSVLNLIGHVIILEGMESLSAILKKQLQNYFLDSRIFAVNKVILSINRQEILKEILNAVPYHYVYIRSYYEQPDKRKIIRRNLQNYEIDATEERIAALEKIKFATEMDLKRALASEDVSDINTDFKQKADEGLLERVNTEYVLKILKEENGNRTKAAQKLGISRTTLWRILKKLY